MRVQSRVTFRNFNLHPKYSAAGKQCFDCEAKADEPDWSDCGNFDETTDKCTVPEDGFCFKAAIYREEVINGTTR